MLFRSLLTASIFAAAVPSASAMGVPFSTAGWDVGGDTLTLSAVSHRAKHRPASRERNANGQIACTKYGCAHIPPNCHPTAAFYWDGTPTGYDAIACH